MANNLQIKRSAYNATANPTGTNLEYGELGWNNGQNRLWIGRATDNSSDGSPSPFEIVGRQATATAPGAAGFSADNFDISAADYANDDGSIVSIKDEGIDLQNMETGIRKVTVGTTEFTLGATGGTTIAGLTSIDFTNANCTIGATVGDGKTITIGGHANTQIKIKGDLIVEGDTTTVSSTEVTVADKTFVLGSGATSAALDEGGVLFSDVASIKWDHDTTKLKSSHIITGSYVDTTYSVGDGGLTQKNFTTTLKSKLDGIEANATADQTAAEMRTAIGTGNGNLVPTIGTAGHFLKHDGTFGALPSDSNTTYSMDVASATTKLTLQDSASGSPDQVELAGAGSVTVARTNSAKLTITGTDTTYSVGDGGLTQNNFTNADHTKLDGIAASANNYSLPLSASGTRGGIQIGYTESGKNYPVELDSEKAYVNVPWVNTTYSVGDGGLTQNNFTNADHTKLDGIAASANNYSLPLSSSGTRGGVKIGYTESGKNYPVELDSEKMFVNVPWTNTTYSVGDGGLTQNNFTNADHTKLDGIAASANNYSLPLAASGTRGGVKVGYTESGKNYPVELSSEKMYVNVPWTDTVYTLTLAAINTVTSTTGDMISANSTIDCGSVTWG